MTLGTEGRSPAPRLLDAALTAWDGPIEGRLDRVEPVRFRPMEVLRGESLPMAAAGG